MFVPLLHCELPHSLLTMMKMNLAQQKHFFYELSVQSPRWQVDYLPQFHRFLTGKTAYRFREDFCGTGKISCEWVKQSKRHFATGLDLDSPVLQYANSVNKKILTPDEKKRVQFLKQNVLKTTREKFDMIGAFNFSYFIFHERKELLNYARAVHASLSKKGTLFLEIAGGSGFLKSLTEKKTFKVPGFGKVEQIWEQHQFDPITALNDYSIHFKLPNGKWLNDAFTYHWRIWNIREVREILEEAGFKKTVVLWEQSDENGKLNGEYLPTDQGENFTSWLGYIVAVK